MGVHQGRITTSIYAKVWCVLSTRGTSRCNFQCPGLILDAQQVSTRRFNMSTLFRASLASNTGVLGEKVLGQFNQDWLMTSNGGIGCHTA